MSRTHKAGIIAIFGYLQFGLAFVSGILLVPFILRRVGVQSYGLWLACGDLLAHSAMVDLGVLSVLPWLIAEKDGQQDREGMRNLLNNALAIALLTSILYLIVALLIWKFASSLAQLSDAQRATIIGPLLLVVAGTLIAFPLRAFSTVLIGLQDVVFTGYVNLGLWAMNICLVVGLLLKGYGLYALAAAAAIPPLVSSIICLLRVKFIAPYLFEGWRRPSFSQMSSLIQQGLGTWMGGLGWRMIAVSNSIIIMLAIGSPEMVVVYACTAKLGEILMQLAWQLSDSGLVGLAQLYGEGNLKRVREVVLSMIRILLIAAGGVAVLVLALNASFVSLWVGADKFGGSLLNILLAAGVLGLSLTHGLLVPTAAIGKRFQVGLVTLLQGGVNLVFALTLGYLFGLRGIAAASLITCLTLAFPLGARLLKSLVQISFGDLLREALLLWLSRAAVLLIASALAGIWLPRNPVLALLLAPLLGFIYVWHMRPLYAGLPLPLKIRPWLMKMRLIPQQ